ncbi:hypothetical protein ACWGR4_38165 [Embleya sp. NPDC055664]
MRSARNAVGAAGIVLMLVAGCAETPDPSGSSPDETASDVAGDNSTLSDRVLYTRVSLAAMRVRTVHLRGVIRVKARTVRMDMRIDLGSKAFTATVEEVGVGVFDLVGTGSEVYLKGDAGTWSRTNRELAERLTDKYVRLPSDSPLVTEPDRIKDLADMRELAEAVRDGERHRDAEVDGRRMIVLGGHDDTLGDMLLYIPAEGTALPARMTVGEGADTGITLDWLDFDQPVVARRPDPDRIVELAPGQRV